MSRPVGWWPAASVAAALAEVGVPPGPGFRQGGGMRYRGRAPISVRGRMYDVPPVRTVNSMISTDRSLPTYFPAWLDKVQVQYMNPGMRRIAPLLPGFAVVVHVGRKSGTRYETPVSIFRRGGIIAVVLLHGETNWARNVVAAGQASLLHRGDTLTVRNPRILRPHEATAELPYIARLANRVAGAIVFDVA